MTALVIMMIITWLKQCHDTASRHKGVEMMHILTSITIQVTMPLY